MKTTAALMKKTLFLFSFRKKQKLKVGQNGPVSSSRSTKVELKGAGSAKMTVTRNQWSRKVGYLYIQQRMTIHDDDKSTYLICYLGIASACKSTVMWTKCCSAVVYKHV